MVPLEMTRERLEAYRSNKEEIGELQYKLNHLGKGDTMMGNSVIFDYKTGYKRPQSVVGYDEKKHNRLSETYRNRIEKLQKECEEVELWIEAIEDGLTRRIFRMYFIDGLSQQQVSKRVHLSQSKVSEKITIYLNRDKKDKKV